MEPCMKHRLPLLCAGALLAAPPAAATGFEGGFFGALAFSGKKHLDAALPPTASSPGFNSGTTFEDQWGLGGLSLAYTFYQKERWGFWVGSTYSRNLGNRPFKYNATWIPNTGNPATLTQSVSGEVGYQSLWLGLGVSWAVSKRGELSFSAGPRSQRITFTGNARLSATLGQDTFTPMSFDASGKDWQLSFSGTTLQDQDGFQTFQRLTLSSSFGDVYGEIEPSTTNWQMTQAHVERTRPMTEVRVTFGFRF